MHQQKAILKEHKTVITGTCIVLLVVIANLIGEYRVCRWDLTDDKRYSLSEQTKTILGATDSPIDITCYLNGELNSGFKRLQQSVKETVEEMNIYSDVRWHLYDIEEGEKPQAAGQQLSPVIIHERAKDGRTAQTAVYPYAEIKYNGKSTVINLLKNIRGQSGEENLNASIEGLEYAIVEGLHSLTARETVRIAFIEGHGELDERHVQDISAQLSRYFQIDRGTLGNDVDILDNYKVIIIADPQGKFSEKDKYIIDQYIMRGGRVLWLINGVQFSGEVLSKEGFTPVLPLDINIQDMLFRYGLRIQGALVQDVQCLPIPVDVSTNPEQPNYQPIPWYYAPLLLTSQVSPITRNVMQVNSSFVSPIESVGGDDGLHKEILLATSTASRVIPTPAEVDLGDFNPDMETFKWQYIPIAVAVEGNFNSLFAHRMAPEDIISQHSQLKEGKHTRQIIIGSGSVIRNEWQSGQPLPAGYDRYSGMQFGNRDFIVNCVLWLSDDEGLMSLRGRTLTLRLLNDKKAHDKRAQIQTVSTIIPIVILGIIGGVIITIRRYKYSRKR